MSGVDSVDSIAGWGKLFQDLFEEMSQFGSLALFCLSFASLFFKKGRCKCENWIFRDGVSNCRNMPGILELGSF